MIVNGEMARADDSTMRVARIDPSEKTSANDEGKTKQLSRGTEIQAWKTQCNALSPPPTPTQQGLAQAD